MVTEQSPRALLRELQAAGVQIWIHQGRVRYRPHPVLTPERLAALRTCQAELRDLLLSAARTEPATSIPPTRPERIPLTFAQEGMWFLEQLGSLGSAYNVVTTVRIEGPLEIPALERSVGEIIRRHEPLRTRIRNLGGVGVQVVCEPEPGQFVMTDLHGLPAGESAAAVTRRVAAHAHRRFLLEQEPAFLCELVTLTPRAHLLIVTAHHLLFDGPSTEILFRELDICYQAHLAGNPSTLPPLPIGYPDYAVWERSRPDGQELREDRRYWVEQLTGAPDSLALPLDRARPPAPDFLGDIVSLELPAPLVRRLRELARTHGSTLFTVLLAAYHALLAQWSGEQDICVGVPVDGRATSAAEQLIGCFVNTIVVRAAAPAHDTFTTVLRRVHEAVVGAFDHRGMPFNRLVAELRPRRQVDSQPLFQVMFSYLVQDQPQLAGTTLTLVEPLGPAAKFDLSLFAAETGQTVTCTVEYATALFDQASIELLVARYLTILETVSEQVETQLGDLPLPAAEQSRLAALGSVADPAIDTERLIHQLVEATAAKLPDAIAVVSEDRELTYRELNEAANRVAHRLRAVGIGAESRVAVSAARSPELVVGLLGVLKAGAAYLPLDPSYPANRLEYMLSDSGAEAVLTTGGWDLPTDATVLALDTVLLADGPWQGWPITDPEPVTLADNAAYIIYTSGSTGLPKGVVVAHRGVMNRFAWQQREVPLEPDDVVLQKTPTSFDVSVWELFLPLTVGAMLVLAAPGRHGDPAYLRELIALRRITIAHFVPSMLRSFLAGAHTDRTEWTSLRLVICSGEELPLDLVAQFRSSYSCELYNLYGPTEASIEVTVWRCTGQEQTRIPIGRAVSNTPLYVLDDQLRPVPIGATGQLYIGGVQLARGYWGQAGLTAQRFLPDPFTGHGQRMYRSGDLVRWRADAALEFIGRADFQIKIRGFRIEPGEVEAALRRHPSIADTAVTAREDTPGDQRLIAYLVLKDGHTFQPEPLRQHLATTLPAHMRPNIYLPLTRLPLTANGKLDRTALPAPTPQPDNPTTRQPPATPTERTLAAIWTDRLKTPHINRDDSFFTLGGHSLLATLVIARIEQHFATTIPLAQFYAQPTLTHLAHLIDTNHTPTTHTDRLIVDGLLREAHRRGVRVSVEDGELCYQAERGPVDQRPVRVLERYRKEVIQRLSEGGLVPSLESIARPRSAWLSPLGQSANAEAVLYLIPAAGSGPRTYSRWATVVPEQLEVHCLRPPGREERFDEPSYVEVGPLADRIADEVLSHLADRDVPFALFGHSAGGLIAYRVARRIDDPRLRLVAVAGTPPPDLSGAQEDVSDEELLEALRAWGATPEELIGDADAMAAFLPRLRADLAVVTSCHQPWAESDRLDVPMIAFEGSADESASPGDAAAWARWTRREFTRHTITGGHYFPVTAGRRVLDDLTVALGLRPARTDAQEVSCQDSQTA